MAEGGKENTKKVFFSGVLLLTLSTLLVKLIGLVCKIPMLSYLGSEGMGYFNSAYEIYALFCIIATAGLPVALSVLISSALAKGDGARVRTVMRISLTVFLSVGVLGTVLMLAFARRFCELIRSEGAYLSILSIAPTVFFVCLSSALRGYFQGYNRMLPTALSQVIEALGKLILGVGLARMAVVRGADTHIAAAWAGLGLTLGTAAATLYLLLEKLRFHPAAERQDRRPRGEGDAAAVLRSLGALSVPMTLGASMLSLTKLVDMALILRRLQSIGLTEAAANAAYGGYTTLALSVYALLPSLINAVALPLVPALAAAIAAGDREKQAQMIATSYRLTAFFALPAALGIAAFARPVLQLLFGQAPDAVDAAAPLLSCLGVSVFLSCMITATNSVLHAYRVVKRPILALAIGALLKLVSAYVLIGIPRVAMLGAPISTFLCNAAVVLLNLYFAAKLCPVEGTVGSFLRPLGAAASAVGLAFGAYLYAVSKWGEGSLVTLSAVLLAVGLYLLFAYLFGAVRPEELGELKRQKREEGS